MDEELAAWCRRWLGAEPRAVLFRAGYLSQLTGLRLTDGRGVVVKARAGLDVAGVAQPGGSAGWLGRLGSWVWSSR